MIQKGLILAAGRGTRLYPATIVIGKPLLPIFDKPMIYYSLSVLMQSQIRDICIVTNQHDRHLFEELLGDGQSWGVNIQYRIQHEPKGIADVFNVAHDFIDNDPCALILGDNLFLGTTWKNRLLQLQQQPMQGAHIFVHPVVDPERFGVITIDQHQQPQSLIEKPSPAPSNLAVTGLYCYDEQACEMSLQLKPSARGELEITELNDLYLLKNQLHLTILDLPDDEWFDIGTHDAMYEAIDKISSLIHTTGSQIGCIEEIAFHNQWIDASQLERMAHRCRHTAYGRYLERYFRT